MRAACLAALLALCAGCQGPDVGGPCGCQAAPCAPGQLSAPVSADWFQTGDLSCDNLVCMASPVPASGWSKSNPYCSKACVSDRDCYRSETGLACRQVVLDPEFLAALDEATRRKYLGDIAFSSYCAIPLP